MLRLLISATLVLAGASASGGAAAKDPWPHRWTVSVYLCGDTGLGVEERCPEGAATPSQIDAATVAVASDPRITEARLVDPEEGAEGFEHTAEWSNAPDKTDWSSLLSAKDLPYSIVAEAVAEAVPEVLIEDFERIPAGTYVYVWPVMYWSGRADVRVQMCGPANQADLSCKGRGAATGAELAAVADHLRALPGDPIVYEETPAHARWNYHTYLRRLGPRWKLPTDVYFGTKFWVDLDDTTGLTELLHRLITLPGVRKVSPN